MYVCCYWWFMYCCGSRPRYCCDPRSTTQYLAVPYAVIHTRQHTPGYGTSQTQNAGIAEVGIWTPNPDIVQVGVGYTSVEMITSFSIFIYFNFTSRA